MHISSTEEPRIIKIKTKMNRNRLLAEKGPAPSPPPPGILHWLLFFVVVVFLLLLLLFFFFFSIYNYINGTRFKFISTSRRLLLTQIPSVSKWE